MRGHSGKVLTRTKATPEPALHSRETCGLEGSEVTETLRNTKLRSGTPPKR